MKQSATHEQVGEKELAKMKKRNEKEERSARAALAAHQATPEQLLCMPCASAIASSLLMHSMAVPRIV